MLSNISDLRRKLEKQVLSKEPYDKVLATSRDIDTLLVRYYNEKRDECETLILIE